MMMNGNVRTSDMNPILKSFLLVMAFGIVAMPFVGILLILRRESGLVIRIIGLIMMMVAIAAWVYVGMYSIH